MITRRGFFGSMAAIVGALISVAKSSAKELNPSVNPEDKTIYRGYRVKWTGWKACQNSDLLAGQWVGHPLKVNGNYDESRPCLYTSAPGTEGAYYRGDFFNLSVMPGQKRITCTDNEIVKDRARRRAGKRLFKMIDCIEDHPETRSLPVHEWNFFLGRHGVLPSVEAEKRRASIGW